MSTHSVYFGTLSPRLPFVGVTATTRWYHAMFRRFVNEAVCCRFELNRALLRKLLCEPVFSIPYTLIAMNQPNDQMSREKSPKNAKQN